MYSENNLLILTFVISAVFSTIRATEMKLTSDAIHRSKRQLLFPNSTTLQFNAGIGFPSSVKNININYAFQANFQLPWNRTQIPGDIFLANSGYDGDSRKKRDLSIRDDSAYQDEAKLYHFYHHIEGVLDGFGYNGSSCVLHTLCQLGAEPLHTEDEEDLLHEVTSFVLNPMNDIANTVAVRDEAFPYITAYKHGQNMRPCDKLYDGCSISLIDFFTKRHDMF